MKLINRYALAVASALLLGTAVAADATTPTSALYWMVNNDAMTSIYGSTWQHVSDASDKVNAARIHATSGDSSVYLNLYNPGSETTIGSAATVAHGYTYGAEDFEAGIWADVSDYTGYSFTIELGNYNSTGDTWDKFAWGETMSYADLNSAGYISTIGIGDGLTQAWTGVSTEAGYSIPEPTSGMLFLMGGALLALRRRRNAKQA